MQQKKKEKWVDPKSIPATTPVPGSVWAGCQRRGIVLEVSRTTVTFQAIFDSSLDVRELPLKEFLVEYYNTPLVSADYLWDVHKRFADAAGATVKARTSLSAHFTTSQEMYNMATTKKSPKPVAKKAAPAEGKKSAAPTKKNAPAESTGPGRKSAFNDSMKITVLVKENPKRAKAAERFALYKNGLTIGEYIAAGGTLADIRWDVKQSFISVK